MVELGKDEGLAASDLQFDRVESPLAPSPESPPVADLAPRLICQLCQAAIPDSYFEVQGAVACSSCHAKALADWNRGTPAGRLLRSLFLGSLAGLLGCLLYYAVLKLTGYEFGLIAILVGFAVGFAVRSGSRGRGGWAYQLMAVGITYLSIVFSYLPLVFGAMPPPEAATTEARAAIESEESAATAAAAPEAQVEPGAPPRLNADQEIEINIFDLVVLVGLILAMPFLAGFENILGLIIIGFGLWEAWRINRKQEWHAAGPFKAAPAAAS